MADLPFVDVHTIAVTATPELIWASLIATLRANFGKFRRVARLLGCVPAKASQNFTGRVGQTLPGFQVVEADVDRKLALAGRHRFSRYRLTFEITEGRLSARTNAEFPGVRGKAYRAAVIGSHGHEVLVQRMLRTVAAGTRTNPATLATFRRAVS
jgi:hypothetical protein